MHTGVLSFGRGRPFVEVLLAPRGGRLRVSPRRSPSRDASDRFTTRRGRSGANGVGSRERAQLGGGAADKVGMAVKVGAIALHFGPRELGAADDLGDVICGF